MSWQEWLIVGYLSGLLTVLLLCAGIGLYLKSNPGMFVRFMMKRMTK